MLTNESENNAHRCFDYVDFFAGWMFLTQQMHHQNTSQLPGEC